MCVVEDSDEEFGRKFVELEIRERIVVVYATERLANRHLEYYPADATDHLQSSFWTKRLVDVSPRPVGQKSTPSCFVVDLE